MPGGEEQPKVDQGEGNGEGGGEGETADGDAAADGGADGAEEERPSLSGGDALTAKATNDAVAFIRGLAELRGRNADWAEKAVREAASLSAAQALERNVIDLMAGDVDALLEKADGMTVEVAGDERTLTLAGARVEEIQPDAITRLLSVLSNPNVAFVLMMIGIYGLIFEFTNPGAIFPGVMGAICLILGLYALNQLPLDYAGLALVLLGIALMVAEAFSPSLGILGFGGLAAFVIGAAMLFDTDVPAYQLDWWLIGVMAALSGSVLVLILGYTIQAYRGRPVSGDARMVGAPARVLEWRQGDAGGEGFVWTEGERWRASGPADLEAGESVRVRRIEGLSVVVERDEVGATEAARLRGEARG
jgi:membrane-bound serine protease (ClpP class)